MNKLLVFMVSLTLLLWGAFLWKMADRVDAGKNSGTEVVNNVPNANLDMRGLLARLEPQPAPATDLRDPFRLPKQFAPPPRVARPVVKNTSNDQTAPAPVKTPAIELDAILPGANPVAILKYRGESAVVSVGQDAWGATVVRIRDNSVTLRVENIEFEAIHKN